MLLVHKCPTTFAQKIPPIYDVETWDPHRTEHWHDLMSAAAGLDYVASMGVFQKLLSGHEDELRKTCYIVYDFNAPVATIATVDGVIRCMAVHPAYRGLKLGEGLLTLISDKYGDYVAADVPKELAGYLKHQGFEEVA